MDHPSVTNQPKNQNIDWALITFGFIHSLLQSLQQSEYVLYNHIPNGIKDIILIYIDCKEYFSVNMIMSDKKNPIRINSDATIIATNSAQYAEIHGNINIHYTNNWIHKWSFKITESRGIQIGISTRRRRTWQYKKTKWTLSSN
eukprot:461414_1